MSRPAIALSFAVIVAVAGTQPAAAFHPFDDNSGYQMPERLKKRAPGTAAPSRNSQQAPAPSYYQNDDDEDDLPARPQRRQTETVRGPAVLDGGGRPSISASAPPVVSLANSYGTGSIIIDTSGRSLYYILSSTSAYKYPISVGRQGFTWTGTERISRVASWPDWRPPTEMKQRQPGLPDLMTGGVRNPLGARALYLGNSLYRIHGTNDVDTIGQAASSGCFRMINSHVIHLSGLAGVGTTVRVVNRLPSNNIASNGNGSASVTSRRNRGG